MATTACRLASTTLAITVSFLNISGYGAAGDKRRRDAAADSRLATP